MKKKIISLAVLLVISIPVSGVFAASTCQVSGCKAKCAPANCSGKKCAEKKCATKSKKVVSSTCPVIGTKIPDVTKAAGKSVYKGKTYYFCCAGCKPKFDKNPQKYIGKKK